MENSKSTKYHIRYLVVYNRIQDVIERQVCEMFEDTYIGVVIYISHLIVGRSLVEQSN